MTDREYLQRALHTFNDGNWYGWKKEDDNGNVIPNVDRDWETSIS